MVVQDVVGWTTGSRTDDASLGDAGLEATLSSEVGSLRESVFKEAAAAGVRATYRSVEVTRQARAARPVTRAAGLTFQTPGTEVSVIPL